MRTLYTVCYPDIAPDDLAFIEELREQHDLPYCNVVAAHFTLVFGVREISEPQYVNHVQSVAASSKEIPFTCRYAMLGADDLSDAAYVFLVPDEGYSSVSLLHDRLYSGPLERFHRLDIPYIPHITIATLQDRQVAKMLCTQLNREGLCIAGTLRAVTVGALEDGKFTNLASVGLHAA